MALKKSGKISISVTLRNIRDNEASIITASMLRHRDLTDTGQNQNPTEKESQDISYIFYWKITLSYLPK